MAFASMELTGAAELEKKLATLEPKIGKKVMRQALRKGAKVIQQAQKAAAASNVGGEMGQLIAKNIIVRALKKKRKNQYGALSLIRPGVEELIHTSADGTRYFIPAAIEFGHAAPGAGGSGAKDVPAVPFARPGFDATKKQAATTTISEIRKGIERIGAEK